MRRLFAASFLVLGLTQSSVCVAQSTDSTAPAPTPGNQYDLGFAQFRVGLGFLIDHAAYYQGDVSSEQHELMPGFKLRDARVLFNLRFKGDRPVTLQTGIMYDGTDGSFRFRQSGIMVPLPSQWGRVFIGRAKEGVSLNKVMIGYDGWTIERSTFSDVIPILADGIKWMGYLPKQHLLWNLGYFTDWQSKWEGFSTYETQATARVAFVTMDTDSTGDLVHIGVNGRYGEVENGQLRLRSRPESWQAPYFLDTDTFPAASSRLAGLEAYYRNGSWLFGTEYYMLHADSPERADPLFHGGDIFVSWLITGETRAYNTDSGAFRGVVPARKVSRTSLGAWEAVLRFSYSDLDDELVQGGRFWRLTPMVNWHLSRNVRLGIVYGYGMLDRFGLNGGTQFFQSRLQLQF